MKTKELLREDIHAKISGGEGSGTIVDITRNIGSGTIADITGFKDQKVTISNSTAIRLLNLTQ